MTYLYISNYLNFDDLYDEGVKQIVYFMIYDLNIDFQLSMEVSPFDGNEEFLSIYMWLKGIHLQGIFYTTMICSLSCGRSNIINQIDGFHHFSYNPYIQKLR